MSQCVGSATLRHVAGRTTNIANSAYSGEADHHSPAPRDRPWPAGSEHHAEPAHTVPTVRETLRSASQARFERLKRRVLVSVGAEGQHGRVMIGGDKEVCGQDSLRKLVERLGATNHPDRKRWPA